MEHPVIPLPAVDGSILYMETTGGRASPASLSRRDRFRFALQLTSVASLLAEFDLWPGRAALRDAVLRRVDRTVRAGLAGFPMSLSRVSARLGGGEAAAERIRNGALDAIAEAVGLPRDDIGGRAEEPGFFLEAAIARQLRELPRPLDPMTARCLWAVRWDVPPLPEPGETSYWSVPIPAVARRMAAGLWVDIRRRRRPAWLWRTGRNEGDTAQLPAVGMAGTLVVEGELRPSDLASVARWTHQEGCSAVVFGRFPKGWYPPAPPGFDSRRLTRHLAVTGVPLETARRVIDERRDHFEALDAAEEMALTVLAQDLFETPPRTVREGRRDLSVSPVKRLLQMAPGGLPEGFVTVHSGLSPSEVDRELGLLSVISRNGIWRLAAHEPLRPDPLHSEVANLFDQRDDRRRLHLALGSGDSTELEKWARDRLENLEGPRVRDLLGSIAPGSLGNGVQRILAEACLSALDLAGARSAIAAIGPNGSASLAGWLQALDPAPGCRRELPEPGEVEIAPRAVAEATILFLREDLRFGGCSVEAANELLDRCLEDLSGPVRRLILLEQTALNSEEKLADTNWRRELVDGHSILMRRLIHRRALQFLRQGRSRPAARLLQILTDDWGAPGIQGIVQLDLGAVALDQGRSREADTHQLRAFRLLQAAGFQNLTRLVLFNLAVADLDQLRVARAADRLDRLETEAVDPFVEGERVRLALAIGDEEGFRQRLHALVSRFPAEDPRYDVGFSLLRGIADLLAGDIEGARRLLSAGGQEGESWLALVDVVEWGSAEIGEPDEWGVSLAAELLSERRAGSGHDLQEQLMERPDLRGAFGVALAERVGGTRLPLHIDARRRAAAVLREGGLNGWSEALEGTREKGIGAIAALSKIVEMGGPAGLETELGERLVRSLGLGGLEVRLAGDRSLIWRAGSGSAGAEIQHGGVLMIPLGGEAGEDPTWRLLAGILELLLPPRVLADDPEVGETGFFGVSAEARSFRQEMRQLGPTSLPVLLVGETGVGKEVAARGLHRLSGRSGRFIAVNVAAIPANLLEAELFGSIKGAFTGADRSRRGLAVAADGGSLFLDEIGDLDPPLQVKLLRFLESQEVRPVGSDRAVNIDVRIISATHRDLERCVREGSFRQDLYYRIAFPTLAIPPLRERREDIPLLKKLFEDQALARHGLSPGRWSREAEAALAAYHWPGNVRELRQTVEVAMVRAAGASIGVEHLGIPLKEELPTGTWEEALADFRRRFLLSALRRNAGNRSATARELGISRQALLYHIRALGLAKLE
ncbi:MAG: sigma 54-interacting transcriptional regulator [Thermoanaerobaculales bacterium]